MALFNASTSAPFIVKNKSDLCAMEREKILRLNEIKLNSLKTHRQFQLCVISFEVRGNKRYKHVTTQMEKGNLSMSIKGSSFFQRH